MITSILIEEALNKIQHLLMICKNLSKLGKEFFNLINGICRKTIAEITLNDKRLNALLSP